MALREASELEQRARRAYEWSRLRSGVGRSWPAIALSGISLSWCNDLELCLLCGLLLVASSVGLLWRGQAWGRASRPALLSGVAPALAPMLGQVLERVLPAVSCSTSCALVCIVGGVVGGGLFGYRAARFETEKLPYLVSGAVILTLAGSLGCLQMGTLGFTSMLGGFVLGGIPVVAIRSLARRGP